MKLEGQHGQRLLGYAGSLLAGLCAGLIWPLNKQLGHDLSSAQVTWVEALVAMLVLAPVYLCRFRAQAWPKRTPVFWLLLFGLTAAMLFYLRTLGTILTNPTTGSLVARTEVLLVFLFGYFVLKESLRPLSWLGAAALLAGMIFALDLPHEGLAFSLGGLAALLGCALGIASNAIIIRLKLNQVRNELTALANVSCQFAVLTLVLALSGGLGALPGALAQPHTLSLALLGGLLVPGMLTPYYYAMKRIPLWATRLFGLSTPAVAMLTDHFWLKSHVTAGQLAGLALVTGGAALVILAGLPEKSPEGTHGLIPPRRDRGPHPAPPG